MFFGSGAPGALQLSERRSEVSLKKYEEMYYFAKNSKKIVKLMNVRDSNVSVTTNFPSIVLKSLEFSKHRSA